MFYLSTIIMIIIKIIIKTHVYIIERHIKLGALASSTPIFMKVGSLWPMMSVIR